MVGLPIALCVTCIVGSCHRRNGRTNLEKEHVLLTYSCNSWATFFVPGMPGPCGVVSLVEVRSKCMKREVAEFWEPCAISEWPTGA